MTATVACTSLWTSRANSRRRGRPRCVAAWGTTGYLDGVTALNASEVLEEACDSRKSRESHWRDDGIGRPDAAPPIGAYNLDPLKRRRQELITPDDA